MAKKTQLDKKIEDTRVFGAKEAANAMETYRKYAQGKTSIDLKAQENQEWWRLRHWGQLQGETNEGNRAGHNVGSAWLVNSLLNKHADIMDSFPKPNILPREKDDEQEAKILSDIVPVILEQNDYEDIYKMMAYDICIDGAAITGIFWDSSKHDGMGDITVRNVDVHNLFWEPGITDIQDSKAVFYATLQDVENVKRMWPEIADKIGPNDPGTIIKYLHDDNIDTSNMVEIVDCYYKKTVMQPIMMGEVDISTGEQKQVQVASIPRTVVHLAILCGDNVLWCSENEEGYENGFYEHGKYPFVVRRLFPVKDSVWGFGYLDIMKNPQKDIDKLDQAIIKNAMQKANNRYAAKKNSNINMEQFADWSQEIVEVSSGDVRETIQLIETGTMPATAQQHLERKIDELKETSGNRDFSQGSTSSGVTAASAIAALQEAGSKLSRDINKELYRGSREEYYLIIELIRQFYSQPRTFRVMDSMNQAQYVEYSNVGLVPQDITTPEGTRHRKPLFDIEISAEKQSPFSRAAQNETAKELYSMGMFNPQMAEQALVCLSMMDFEGKDEIEMKIQQNSIMMQQFQAAMNILMQVAQVDPAVAQMMQMSGLLQGQAQPMPSGGKLEGTAEERAADKSVDNSQAGKMRRKVSEATNPNK